MPIKLDDVCFNKAAIIERSVRRALEEYAIDPGLQNCSHIDAMTLNIERACQAAIDLAMHLVARNHLGVPQTSADAFNLLKDAGYISKDMSLAMVKMTGFRNIAVHEYQKLNLAALHKIGKQSWSDLVCYCKELGMNIKPRGQD